MNEIYEKKRRLTISALVHYIERLKKLETDGDVTPLITEPLLKDLTDEQSEAEKIINHVKEKGFEMESEFETKIFGPHSHMKNTLTAALLCYYEDMTKSLEVAPKKMKIGSDYSSVKKEIEFCKEFLNKLAKDYGTETKIS